MARGPLLSPTAEERGPTGTSTAGSGVGLSRILVSIWEQMVEQGAAQVEVAGQRLRVQRTRAQQLRFVEFVHEGRAIEGIEQNPNTASRWAKLAQEGHRIVQFRCGRQYIGNVCDGTLLRYPRWKSLNLPD